ncbi:MAG TPA: MoxR family ATPase [Acidimicrobiales bacterium]|nr:MoxR family ATPase [Acidimicrobiales bacterium]
MSVHQEVADAAAVGTRVARVLDEMGRAVIGKRDAIALVLVGILGGGHVLLEDVPGTAKTSIARGLSRVLGLEMSRIQFTPDLMPSDVTGSSILDRRSGELVFQPGPVFANLVLGDEINRATPKTQAALLEAMQEHQVTTDGVTRLLPQPFIVVATENPVEFEGTYPLPEAQLDRFMLRTAVGYPDDADEWEIVRRRAERGTDEVALEPVLDAATVLEMKSVVERVVIDESVGRYLVELTRSTRDAPGVEIGASPRAALALLQASRALAAIRGRGYVLPDDVKTLAVPCLAHRLTLRPDLWLRGTSAEDVMRQCLERVPVPVDPEEG